MAEKKSFRQKLLDGDSMAVNPVDRFLEEQAKRRARKAAQTQALKAERRRRQDASAEPTIPLWQRLMQSVGVEPPADSFKRRLLDRLEGRQ